MKFINLSAGKGTASNQVDFDLLAVQYKSEYEEKMARSWQPGKKCTSAFKRKSQNDKPESLKPRPSLLESMPY